MPRWCRNYKAQTSTEVWRLHPEPQNAQTPSIKAVLVAELTGSGLNKSPDSKPQNTHIMPTVVIIAGRPPIQPDPASLLKAKLPEQPQCPQPPLSRSLEEMRLGAECLRLKAALVQQAEKITRLEEENRALTKAVHRLA